MEQIKLNQGARAAHQYLIETRVDGRAVEVIVNAHNRAVAARLAERAGYEVWSVNMIG